MNYVERRRFLCILLLAALTLLAIAANATTLARMRFEDLAQQATAVARLRCLSSQSFWHNGEIWTDTQFDVVEQAKGALPAAVIVRTLGGTVGHFHSSVEDAPVFHPGEDAFLFLWGGAGEPLQVLGWSQGTFRIARDTRTGAETVTQDSAAVPLFDPQSRRFVHEGIRNLSLTIFHMKLRRALRGGPPR
jgi:hypothetical protein